MLAQGRSTAEYALQNRKFTRNWTSWGLTPESRGCLLLDLGHFLPKRDLESRLNLWDKRTDFLCPLWDEAGIPHELREHPQRAGT